MIHYAERIEDFRSHVPAAQTQAYFETSGTGLIPDFVHDGIHSYAQDRYLRGGDSIWRYADEEVGTLKMLGRSRAAIAAMLHGTSAEIAFGQSATQLFTMVTDGIDYGPQDNVVTVGGGWIGMRYAWQKKEADGLEVRYVFPEDGQLQAERIMASCDAHTRAVAVNLVENTTGYRVDVETLGAFCRENGILFFVDGVQALGALEVDVEKGKIDFLVGNDYKWMMNYCGTGYAYIRRELQPLIRHWGAGWMSDADRFCTTKARLDLRSDAGRFEIGYPNAAGIYGLGLVAEQYGLLGGKNIAAYVKGLADALRQNIDQIPGLHVTYEFAPEHTSQIVSVTVDPSVPVCNADLEAAGVFAHLQASGTADGERIMRLGLHYYNDQSDIDRFSEAMERSKK